MIELEDIPPLRGPRPAGAGASGGVPSRRTNRGFGRCGAAS